MPDLLCIAGPTASGKTAAAFAIARALAAHGRAAEVISVDSALVYRGMDIGTAKPSRAELAELPHHLVDVLEPTQAYSAAQFVADSAELVRAIRARGAVPLLVGGTMLYFKALREGLNDMPPADPAVRAALEQQAALQGWPALHAELALVDPITAARLAPGDSQRVQRALEVWRITGTPLSSLHATKKIASHAVSTGAFRLISLEPSNKTWLHERIAQRFDAMLAAGLVAEVQGLRARGDVSLALPSMRCVGYRQTWEALDQAEAENTTLQPAQSAINRPAAYAQQALSASQLIALRERGIIATRQLAKRQLTWLRSFEQRTVVACDAPDASAQVLALALANI